MKARVLSLAMLLVLPFPLISRHRGNGPTTASSMMQIWLAISAFTDIISCRSLDINGDPTANMTATLHHDPYLIRHCGEHRRMLIFSIDEVRNTALVTYRDTQQEAPSGAFTTMFKTTRSREIVSRVLRSLAFWTPEGPLAQFQLICVTSDIARLYPRLPIDIWTHCQITSFNVIRIPENSNIYFCPRFFDLPAEPPPGQGAQYYCPSVAENRFVDNPYGLQFPESPNWVLLSTFLSISRRFTPQPPPTSYLVALNSAVGANVSTSVESVYNYLFYLACKSPMSKSFQKCFQEA